MNTENFIPVKDYATKYNMKVQNVYQRLKRGTLRGKKLGSYQLVLDTQKK